MNNNILSQVIENDKMEIIVKQFTRLKDQCYLDNTGAALYAESLIKAVSDDFTNNIYMNPHSDIYSHKCIEGVRELILEHFNTTSDEYGVIFTSGATQALKLLAESFQFGCEIKRGAFVHLCDNHTSVLGLREIVKENNVDIYHIPHEEFLTTMSLNDEQFKDHLHNEIDNRCALFAYPAQNNFNGFKYPISSMDRIKNGCFNKYINKSEPEDSYNWYILLDAASFASTSRLDLTIVKPDFVCISFYKIFGYPTGLGALLVRNNCKHLLNGKKYYGGGTVDTVLNTDTFFARKKEFSERFEDGTVSFLSILALRHCFKILNNLIPKTVNNDIMDTIKHHTFYLGKELYTRLRELKHENGRQAIQFYMDSDYTDIEKQGGVVTFNIIRQDGSFVGYNEFESKALIYKICVRSGCFCNSGSCQRHFKLSNKEIKDRYEAGHKCGGETDLIDGVPTGAIRVSFGYYNTYLDVNRLMVMIFESYLNVYMTLPYTPSGLKDGILKSFKRIASEDGCVKKNYDNKLKTNSIFTLKEIIIYPIEQCGPYRIKTYWNLCDEGLLYNKNWMIKSKSNTTFNQNQIWLMSKINPEIDLCQKSLTLHMQGIKSITMPLDLDIPYQYTSDGEKIFEHDCGDRVANWISDAVRCPNLRLVKLSKGSGKTTIHNNEQHLSCSGRENIILMNTTPTKEISEQDTMNSKINYIQASVNNISLDNIKGNLIVEIPQESFNRDYDRVTIDNHEFKVEGRYQLSIDKYRKDLSNSRENLSEDQFQAIFLKYIRATNEVTKTLEVNSQVKLFKTERKMKRDANMKIRTSLCIDPKNTFTNIFRYMLRTRKKYEVSEL